MSKQDRDFAHTGGGQDAAESYMNALVRAIFGWAAHILAGYGLYPRALVTGIESVGGVELLGTDGRLAVGAHRQFARCDPWSDGNSRRPRTALAVAAETGGLPFADHSFDLVAAISLGRLRNLTDTAGGSAGPLPAEGSSEVTAGAVTEAARVLRPEGTAVFCRISPPGDPAGNTLPLDAIRARFRLVGNEVVSHAGRLASEEAIRSADAGALLGQGPAPAWLCELVQSLTDDDFALHPTDSAESAAIDRRAHLAICRMPETG